MLDNSLMIPFEPQKIVPSFQVGSFICGQQKKRALVPAEKGLVFYGSQKDKFAIYEQIQYTLFITFQTVKLELIEITILDFSIDNSFSSLLNLADCLKISKITDIKAFHDFVDTLRQNAIRINHDILSTSHLPTLAAYNQVAEHPEPYHFVVLTDTWRKADYFKSHVLKELIEKGSQVGIFFICVLDWVAIEEERF